MRTDDLLRTLAADTIPGRRPGAALAAALVLGGAVSLAAVAVLLGFRPDLGPALLGLRVAAKQAWPVASAIAAAAVALRLATPGRGCGPWAAALAGVPAFLAVGATVEMRLLPPTAWHEAMMGQSSGQCLALVTALSVPILPGVLWALRRGASTRPTLSGAAAGLLSGSTAASLYALHCTEDSPLFYGLWYVLAILAVTAAGALLGRRLLRW